jgi:cytochrome c oxidase subunit IV
MSNEHQHPSTARGGTVVWGVILVLTGLAVVAVGTGVEVDLQAALIVVLAVAGVGLLVKALLPGRRAEPQEADDGGPAS